MRADLVRVVGRPSPAGVAAPAAASGNGARPALGNIQVLRGIAATLVLVSHTFIHTVLARGTWEPPAHLDNLAGIVGVAIFFAISGYLMAGLIRRDDPWTFLAHRVTRIFPTYLAVITLTGLLFAALRIPFSVNVFALTLAPTGPRAYPLGVEWTLFFETSFYVGLFLLAGAGLTSRLVPVALAWLAVLGLALVVLPGTPFATIDAPFMLPLSSACVPFAGGLLLPALVARGWARPRLAWPALGLLLVCIPFEVEARRWLCGIGAVLLIGSCVAGRQVSRDTPLRRAAIAFGDWSYVLYLVHVPVIALVLRYAPAGVPGPVLWAPIIACSLGLTALLGPCDVALYRRLRHGLDVASAPGLRRAVAAYLCLFFGFSLYGSAESGQAAWQEAQVRAALAVLPAPAWNAAGTAEAAIVERDLRLPDSLRGEVDSFARISSKEFVLGAWAFDPVNPREKRLLAAFCGARLIGVARPIRLRPAIAALPGLDSARGRRIGYNLRVPAAACEPGVTPLAVLVGPDRRMAVLTSAERSVAVSKAE